MALADNEQTQNEKKSGADLKGNERKEKPLTKIIIRRLPPGITQESFINQVSPLPEYNYIYTVKGDMTLGENAFSRVYINFCNPEDIYAFKEKFDNYVFVDTKGHEYAAVVEYAAFQKVPKKRNKQRPDPKCGTIESEPAYLEFLESLKAQPNQENKPEYSYQPNTENKNDNTTPLLDYIKQRRADRQRIREEKREERKKKELERKKVKDEERKKYYEDKSPNKKNTTTTQVAKIPEEQKDKPEETKSDDKVEKTSEKSNFEKSPVSTSLMYRNRKYEEKKSPHYKMKGKYNTRENDYYERRDTYKDSYKKREDKIEKDYKKKNYDDAKKDLTKTAPKKIKKYSERREEMKAKQVTSKPDVKESEEDKELPKIEEVEKEFVKAKSSDQNSENGDDRLDDYCDSEGRGKNKENDPRVQRRIRNKDRPTMAIYQPGMLRKKHSDEPETKSVKE